jgi:glycosyltransferase involved in cell wall biosynthesis
MKVTQILYSGLGGHGSVAFSLASAAGIRWHSTMIFAGIEPLLPEYARLCEERGIRRAHIQMREGRTWTAWPSVNAELRHAAPQAIVLHSVKLILPCWLYAYRHGIPIIAVEHQPNSLKSSSEWVVSRLLMRLADVVVVLTPEYQAALEHRLGSAYRPEKVHVIPNGIDTTAFTPVERCSPCGQLIRVGMAARFSKTKRQDLLIDALSLLSQDDEPPAWRLSLAGDGESLKSMRRLAEAAEVADLVEFPGYLGEGALREWFAQLDVYAHASEGETLSTSLLQAMAMGLPIVGSNVAGIKELLAEHAGCGKLAESQTPQAFANALREMNANAIGAAAMAGRARALAETRFSQGAMFRAYDSLITGVSARTLHEPG